MKYFVLSGVILCLLVFVMTQACEENFMQGPYTVICIVEAKPGRELELKKMLMDVISPSKSETSCLAYHLHQDLTNPAIFILYEQWRSKEAHANQFTKKYIIELVSKLNELLIKPYQTFFAEEVGVINTEEHEHNYLAIDNL